MRTQTAIQDPLLQEGTCTIKQTRGQMRCEHQSPDAQERYAAQCQETFCKLLAVCSALFAGLFSHPCVPFPMTAMTQFRPNLAAKPGRVSLKKGSPLAVWTRLKILMSEWHRQSTSCNDSFFIWERFLFDLGPPTETFHFDSKSIRNRFQNNEKSMIWCFSINIISKLYQNHIKI